MFAFSPIYYQIIPVPAAPQVSPIYYMDEVGDGVTERTYFVNRSKYCRYGNSCRVKTCTFAHSAEELNELVIKSKELFNTSPVGKAHESCEEKAPFSPTPTEVIMPSPVKCCDSHTERPEELKRSAATFSAIVKAGMSEMDVSSDAIPQTEKPLAPKVFKTPETYTHPGKSACCPYDYDCQFDNCHFSHGSGRKLRTKMCKFGDKCKRRNTCTFAHSKAEIEPFYCVFDEDCVKDDCEFIHTGDLK